LAVDGIEYEALPAGLEKVDERDWPPPPQRVPDSSGDLTISRPDRFFMGVIDEPKVRVGLEPRSYQLPAGVQFLAKSPFVIQFDARGSLDPRYHTRPVVIQVGDTLVGAAASATTRPGRTAVAPASGGDRAPEARKGAEAEDFGDPLAALLQFLEQYSEGAVEATPTRSDGMTLSEEPEVLLQAYDPTNEGSDGAPADSAARPGRVQNVVIDLTGAIRG
jgi:hypothetical protein